MPHTMSHALCQELTDDLFGSLHELFKESNSSESQFRNPQNEIIMMTGHKANKF